MGCLEASLSACLETTQVMSTCTVTPTVSRPMHEIPRHAPPVEFRGSPLTFLRSLRHLLKRSCMELGVSGPHISDVIKEVHLEPQTTDTGYIGVLAQTPRIPDLFYTNFHEAVLTEFEKWPDSAG